MNEELSKKIREINNRMEMMGKLHDRKMIEATENSEEEIGRVQM